MSSRRLYIDSHTDDVFGSFGHIGPSPAESALVIEFTRALLVRCWCGSVIRVIANTPTGIAAGPPLRRSSAVTAPVRSRPLGRAVYTIGNRQQLPVFQPSRFAHRGSAGGHLHPPCRPPGRRGKRVLELYTRDGGTHYTDDQSRPHCAATPTPATAHAHVLHARHHAPC